NLAQAAVGIFELFELAEGVAAASRLAGAMPASPVAVQPIDGDGTQPGAKRAGPVVVLEDAKLADHDSQNVLDQVIGVGRWHILPPPPAPNQRGVDPHQPLPITPLWLQAQSLQQTARR